MLQKVQYTNKSNRESRLKRARKTATATRPVLRNSVLHAPRLDVITRDQNKAADFPTFMFCNTSCTGYVPLSVCGVRKLKTLNQPHITNCSQRDADHVFQQKQGVYDYAYQGGTPCVNNYAFLTSRALLRLRHVSSHLYVSEPRFSSEEGASQTLKIHFKICIGKIVTGGERESPLATSTVVHTPHTSRKSAKSGSNKSTVIIKFDICNGQ